jgi:hypothetical protein
MDRKSDIGSRRGEDPIVVDHVANSEQLTGRIPSRLAVTC